MTLTTSLGKKYRKTARYAEKLAAKGRTYSCPHCGIPVSGPIPLSQHIVAKHPVQRASSGKPTPAMDPAA